MTVINTIVLGIVGLSTIPLAEYFFPSPYKATSVVRIGVGLEMPGDKDARTNGDAPGIALFDGNGERIGFRSGTKLGKIEDGQYKDIKIDPMDRNNNRLPEYISIVAGGDDAICIAYVSLTPKDGNPWIFYGDTAKKCGAAWYHSNSLADLGSAYKPKCFWIAGKKTNRFHEGVGIHIPDFNPVAEQAGGRQQQYIDHEETMCDSAPRFKLYKELSVLNCLPIFNPPLEYTDDWRDADFDKLKTEGKASCEPAAGKKPTAAQIHKLHRWTGGRYPHPTYGYKRAVSTDGCSNNRVVVSELDHGAEELCKDPNSFGPDFVSMKEMLYCDMCTRDIYPVCSSTNANGCFDANANVLRPRTAKQARAEGGNLPVVTERVYQNITYWK